MECSFSLYRMEVMAQKLLSSSFMGDGEATQSSGLRTWEVPDEKEIQIKGFREFRTWCCWSHTSQCIPSFQLNPSATPEHNQLMAPPSVSSPPGTSECDLSGEIGTNKTLCMVLFGHTVDLKGNENNRIRRNDTQIRRRKRPMEGLGTCLLDAARREGTPGSTDTNSRGHGEP